MTTVIFTVPTAAVEIAMSAIAMVIIYVYAEAIILINIVMAALEVINIALVLVARPWGILVLAVVGSIIRRSLDLAPSLLFQTMPYLSQTDNSSITA